MYFTKGASSIYHILAHINSGSAPPPCGVRADRYDLSMYLAGRPTANIVPEKPAEAQLCKHCAASTRKPTHGVP